MQKRKTIILLSNLLFLAGVCQASDFPNVLIFFMDDMGYGDCRAYNPDSKIQLPNLEKLVEEGMLFTDAHSPAAVCAPSRYSILTGNYPWRGRLENGTWIFQQKTQILEGQETLAHVLQRAGYHTAFFGKVHLGGTVYSKSTGQRILWKYDYKDIDFDRPYEDGPFDQGFEYAYSLPQGIQAPPYIAFENGHLVGKAEALKIWEKGTYGSSDIPKKGFGSPDWDSSRVGPILTERALNFLQKHFEANKKRGKRQPFFMHYCSQSCHVPHTPPETLDGEKIKGVHGDPHLDMIFEADVTLGRMINFLEKAGELNNTLIIFTSDNGGLSRGPPGNPRAGHWSCAPLRGSKAQIYEGGHRVPFMVRWDQVTPVGSRSDAIIGLQDIYATLIELTEQTMNADQGLDSQSFLAVLRGEKNAPERETLLVQANNVDRPGQGLMKMVREKEWKLIATKELESKELYNLKADLSETKNLINDANQQDRVRRMEAKLKWIMESKRSTKLPSIHIHTSELFEPKKFISMKLQSSENGKVVKEGNRWRLTGNSPLKVSFIPMGKEPWDISRWRLMGLPIQNNGKGVVVVDGRIANSKPTSWSRYCPGFAVAPEKEKVMLGFVFPQDESTYQGPKVFMDQLAKPNGHRLHWRKFYPAEVRKLSLELRSSNKNMDVSISNPILAWAEDEKRDAYLHDMPFLDKFGQVRALEWPGKIHSEAELKEELTKEIKKAASRKRAKEFSRFGGWAQGPKRKATGNFRTEKIDGRWWLIDPEGYLFFSVGVTSAGFKAHTPLSSKREKANFFEWLPEKGTPLDKQGISREGKKAYVNFPVMNIMRVLGGNWWNVSRASVHDRLRAWGVNTLAAWGEQELQKDAKTPYVLIASMWWSSDKHRKLPSPFREDYEDQLLNLLQKFTWAKDDPYCIGLFLGNELEWPDRLAPFVLELPAAHPTRSWVLKRLREKDENITDLNAVPRRDIEALYFDFAKAYFSKSRKVINKVLPGKLYLGCRTHRGPNVLGRAAAGLVDVFSVNCYDTQARAWQVPKNVDIPILVGEFHYGAVDRGVPSPGLMPVWDQRQRALGFVNYLSSALADSRYVGVHWFRWMDQSAAGRFDRENHQCGFVDVTGRAYSEFVKVVTQATRAMYYARSTGETDRVKMLEALLAGKKPSNGFGNE